MERAVFLSLVTANNQERPAMNRRTVSTISLTLALVATACTGGDAEQALDLPVSDDASQGGRVLTEPSPTPSTQPAPSTTTTVVLAPSTLAFSSSADVGRLFVLDSDVVASTAAGGEPDASAVGVGTVVQASSLRNRDDVLWVRIESTVDIGSTLGWVPADVLAPTTESVFSEDPTTFRQFRQVASSVPDNALPVLAAPGSGSPIGFLEERQVVMHGGVSALSPDGDIWLDIIDTDTSTRLGWVIARSFNRLSSGQITDDQLGDVSRSPEGDVSYGQALVGGISASGCNAIQVTFTNASPTAGLGFVFSTTSPLGRELNSGDYQWSGTSAFSEAGRDIVITLPTADARTWFFAPLDADEQAQFSSVNEEGFAVASEVVSVAAPAASCLPPEPEPEAPVLDEYIDNLPEDQRLEAIAEFERDLAEFEGRTPPVIPESGDPDAEEEAGDDSAAEGDEPVDVDVPEADGESEDPNDPADQPPAG